MKLPEIKDVPFLRESDGVLVTIASDLDSEQVVHLAEIRDREVFRELPLKLCDNADRVADEAEVINVGENDGEVAVV